MNANIVIIPITVVDCWLTAACLFANGSNESRTVLRVWSAPNQLLAMPHHCCAGYTGCRLPYA